MRRVVTLLGWLGLLLLLLPVAWAVWVSFTPDELLRPSLSRASLRWYERFLAEPRWREALVRSLGIATASALLSLMLGTAAALAWREAGPRGRTWLGRLLLLPLLVPPLVLGIGLLPTMYLLGLEGSYPAVIFAHALLGTPLVFLTLRATLTERGREIEDAARGLGASPWQVFWRVTLPLARPGLAAGAGLSFVVSLNDFYLVLFVAGPETETLPRVIWPELRYSLSPRVAVGSVLTLLATLLALLPLGRTGPDGRGA
ncbi:MAG: ABC transporter permease [Gemmataceae bacterium]